MNADGALTRQLANEDLRASAAGRSFSSDVDVEQRDQDDAGGNDSRTDEGHCDAVAGEISRCSKTILRPQATWAKIAIGPTQ
jgi:hypothetical protein